MIIIYDDHSLLSHKKISPPPPPLSSSSTMANNADIPNPHRIIEDNDHDPIGPFEAIPDFCGIARGLMNRPSRCEGGWLLTLSSSSHSLLLVPVGVRLTMTPLTLAMLSQPSSRRALRSMSLVCLFRGAKT